MSDQSGKVFVLVHGSFHGAWAFEKLAPFLVEKGHQVIAQDLPGHGLNARLPSSYLEDQLDPETFATEPSPIADIDLAQFAAPVISSIRRISEQLPGREIVLFGHSFAGLVLNVAGEALPDLIGRLVYLSAFMTANGKTANDYLAGPEFASSKLPSIPVADPAVVGAMRINPRFADAAYRAQLKATLAADIDDNTWAAAIGLLTPDIPVTPHEAPAVLSADRWGAIPRTYISCTDDQAFPVTAHRGFIREADEFTPENPTDVQEIATSHSPFWSRPEELADILVGL